MKAEVPQEAINLQKRFILQEILSREKKVYEKLNVILRNSKDKSRHREHTLFRILLCVKFTFFLQGIGWRWLSIF